MASGEISLEVREPRTHSSGHVEYEVLCSVLELLPGQPSALVIRWSTYRRFSEFVALDYALRTSYGSALEGVDLPPKQWFGTGEPGFIMGRCRSLHAYLQCVQRRCHGLTKFGTHLGSPQLAKFLRWEERVQLAPLPDAVKAAAGFGKPKEEGGAASAASAVGGRAEEAGALGAGVGGSGSGEGETVTVSVSAGNMPKRRPAQSQAAAARLASRKALTTQGPVAQTMTVDSAALGAYLGSAASPSSGFTVGEGGSRGGYSSSSASGSLALTDAPAGSPGGAKKAGGGVTYNPPPPKASPASSPLPASHSSAAAATPAASPPVARPPPPPPSGNPPPPPSNVPTAVAAPDASRASMLNGISNFSLGKLKKTVTVDKSAPKLGK